MTVIDVVSLIEERERKEAWHRGNTEIFDKILHYIPWSIFFILMTLVTGSAIDWDISIPVKGFIVCMFALCSLGCIACLVFWIYEFWGRDKLIDWVEE